MNKGCCNATATANYVYVLSALTDRIASESAGVTNPDFLRGLQVAKLVVREALEGRK